MGFVSTLTDSDQGLTNLGRNGVWGPLMPSKHELFKPQKEPQIAKNSLRGSRKAMTLKIHYVFLTILIEACQAALGTSQL